MSEKRSGVASYDNVDDDYLEKRKLKKSAGWILLWALGVGAVISGDYSGWNVGLKYGGFNGLLIAVFLMATMYTCMVFTIAELSVALPHAGGFFSFTRNAFGPLGGFICGLTDTIEYVITPAVIVYFIGGYMNELIPHVPDYLWWILFYLFFVAINIKGVELTLKVGLFVTVIAISVLVIFFVSALTTDSFDVNLLYNIPPEPGQSATWLPMGWKGVFAVLPFAMWFYLAIEQLPLAAEEAHDTVRDMPRALIVGMATLLLLSLFTLVLNSGVGGGALQIGNSDAPLADGFKAVFGNRAAAKLLTLISLAGLVASFHTVIYAYGRVLFALSRSGYIPRWISLTGKNHTPYVALILGAVIGLGCAFMIRLSGDNGTVGAALLNMAVFGAVISYIMVMCCYIKLRISRPDMERPYKSPLGIPGAVVGALLSLVALVATFSVEEYRPAVIGVAIFVVVGILYFLLYSRHHLVAQAPEEEEALIIQADEELAHK